MKKKSGTMTSQGHFKDGFPFQYNQCVHTGSYQGWHGHEFNEMVLITEGKGYHKTLYGKRRIRKGSVLFIKQHDPHSYQPDDRITVFNLMIGTQVLEEADKLWGSEGELLKLFTLHREEPLKLKPDEFVVCEATLKRLADEIDQHSMAYQGMVLSLFSEFAVNLIRCEHNAKLVQHARHTEDDAVIGRVIQFIGEHYIEKITLEQVAEKGAYSPSYMSSFFRKKTGYTISEYINEIRIQKACEALSQTDQSILDISLDVGYNSISLLTGHSRNSLEQPQENTGKATDKNSELATDKHRLTLMFKRRNKS